MELFDIFAAIISFGYTKLFKPRQILFVGR